MKKQKVYYYRLPCPFVLELVKKRNLSFKECRIHYRKLVSPAEYKEEDAFKICDDGYIRPVRLRSCICEAVYNDVNVFCIAVRLSFNQVKYAIKNDCHRVIDDKDIGYFGSEDDLKYWRYEIYDE